MTNVKFFIGDNRLNGFEISGHSGFASSGSDIVCAAVSSAAEMAANTITEIIGDKADIEVRDGYLKVMTENASANTENVLEGLKLHLIGISEQYPQNIRIIYGGAQNA